MIKLSVKKSIINIDLWSNLDRSFFNNIQIMPKLYNNYTKAFQQNCIR